MSGVPQGTTGISIRPYTVLNIYINDLEDDIPSKVLKFADDKKVFRKVANSVNMFKHIIDRYLIRAGYT